jgi:L-alanine-DL-glutamate epimerase-like enolase superfamily enzyme
MPATTPLGVHLKITEVTALSTSVPYTVRELSAQVARDGVSDVVIRVETDEGLVGWGEACCGSDTESVRTAVEAMTPFVVGRDPWQMERMRRDLWHHGLWQFRAGTGNFAWAGIDMALWDLCGKQVGQPVHRLLGGAVRDGVDYYYFVSGETPEQIGDGCLEGLSKGYGVFYLKVGRDPALDVMKVSSARAALGEGPKIRVDANMAWSPAEARQRFREFAPYGVDFVEQPVREYPVSLMRDLRAAGTKIAANEGLWTENDAMTRILEDSADVYCFSPYWVGSLRSFQFLGTLAGRRGSEVCKHSHGELGIAAAAGHHVMLTLPSVVDGNQQMSAHMDGDVVDIPIAKGPWWGLPEEPGLGIEVDEDVLGQAVERYARDGQFQPYQLADLRASWRA